MSISVDNRTCRSNFLKWPGIITLVVVIAGLFALVVPRAGRNGFAFQGCDGNRASTKIFEGITYGCQQLQPSDEGHGSVYWTRIDLTAPGIELYVTPTDPAALSRGWQYRLRRVGNVVDSEGLAVAINGSLFTSASNWRPSMSGDFANGVETVVSNHQLSHLWEHTYLMWFDDELTPYLRSSKPPAPSELEKAKWGIGGQGVWLSDGKVWPDSDRNPDARTAVAIDQSRKLLFLAVGNDISPRLMLQTLADLGAKDGMLLDGGSSSSMAIGKGARGISAGTVYGGWQPVATHFGVRAKPIGQMSDPTSSSFSSARPPR